MSVALSYGNNIISFGNVAISAGVLEPPEPPVPVLPANTLRLKFKDGYTPTKTGTLEQVSTSPNVWDWTNNYAGWSQAWRYCVDLLEVVAAGDTSNVTGMNYMFDGCTSLQSVSLFDTSNVKDMQLMFNKCYPLQSVPLFNTSNVSSMYNMFNGCTSLQSVPLFDTSNVTNMYSMFSGCSSLKTVPLFDTSNVTSMYNMFNGCTSLQSIPLFDTSKLSNMNRMCYNCYKVESGALALYQQASTQVTPPTSYSRAFYNCGRDTATGSAELAQIPSDWK